MRRTEDISILLTDKDFQRILRRWKYYSDEERAKVYGEYNLKEGEIEILLHLWLGMDFQRFHLSEEMVEDTLNETIWKMAERKIVPEEKAGVKRIYESFSRIAAILIIPIIFYTAYIQFVKDNPDVPQLAKQMVTVSSQPGTVTNLILPDGSRVWLNAGSTISYPNEFIGSTRAISLTGEAYFEVVKDKEIPMVVEAGNVRIKVFGTIFNVNAFSSEPSMKVTLVEGSVSLSSPTEKLHGKEEFFIEPGQTAIFSEQSKQVLVQNEDPFFYTAWKDGFMVFRNTPFETVLKRLSRKFNVDIELKDQTLARIPMDARFRDESINEILRLLSSGTPFKYYYETPGKLPDGTFAKSKIYIERK